MTGAMYAAISGLKSHMQRLNVIGNNIANVNTIGYKSQSMMFSESIYSSVRSGSNGTNVTGGVNPAQLGYGCNVGTIDLEMGTANYVPDGDPLHCMINGDGFFMVGDKPEKIPVDADAGTYTYKETDPASLKLTRVGNFKFDSDGFLVDGGGNVVYGFVTKTTKADGTSDATEDNPAEVSTQLVPIRLPQRAPASAEAGAPPEGTALFPTLGGADGGDRMNVYGPNGAVNFKSVSIDGKTGKITGVDADENPTVIGYIPLAQVPNPAGVTHDQGAYYKAMEGAGAVSVVSVKGSVNGDNSSGTLNNNTGAVSDTNKPKKIEGSGKTELINSGLESSGTDLATEISDMITTQRGYQANTRIITVTDSMLEELVNMKR